MWAVSNPFLRCGQLPAHRLLQVVKNSCIEYNHSYTFVFFSLITAAWKSAILLVQSLAVSRNTSSGQGLFPPRVAMPATHFTTELTGICSLVTSTIFSDYAKASNSKNALSILNTLTGSTLCIFISVVFCLFYDPRYALAALDLQYPRFMLVGPFVQFLQKFGMTHI